MTYRNEPNLTDPHCSSGLQHNLDAAGTLSSLFHSHDSSSALTPRNSQRHDLFLMNDHIEPEVGDLRSCCKD
ncbi:hypothetical protein MJO28_000049 [Puccinia striiformis f. sp. tritici]|uniref:Uncharacterized protein n=1 Tax=Puccinia striiformis f. sp. tritici TaxID=168172 RepID=A0ACC0EWU9_9BASI|nr:hypothetical protein MJO28_000049 [Puccinia striiformis f. sp. tritici]